jgi:hypothetical protein
MLSDGNINEDFDDYEFLSRFHMVKVCNGQKILEWNEWIEPITITARHPFGFGKCHRNAMKYFPNHLRYGRSNTDYVLLQSGHALYNQSLHSKRSPTHGQTQQKRSTKHYLLDAGTSTFDSSLYWFTCGYSQVTLFLFSCIKTMINIESFTIRGKYHLTAFMHGK